MLVKSCENIKALAFVVNYLSLDVQKGYTFCNGIFRVLQNMFALDATNIGSLDEKLEVMDSIYFLFTRIDDFSYRDCQKGLIKKLKGFSITNMTSQQLKSQV